MSSLTPSLSFDAHPSASLSTRSASFFFIVARFFTPGSSASREKLARRIAMVSSGETSFACTKKVLDFIQHVLLEERATNLGAEVDPWMCPPASNIETGAHAR